ncbi:hypothetical protein OFB63_32390, partial [Escherichia coli]|nr:hypothetical protein [Escherichia coli]
LRLILPKQSIVFLVPVQWNSNNEFRAFIFSFTGSRNISSVKFNQVSDNRKPEAESAIAKSSGSILPKSFEHQWQKISADSRTEIADGN